MRVKCTGLVGIRVDTGLEDNMQDLLWIAHIDYPNNWNGRTVQAVGFPAFRSKLLSVNSESLLTRSR